MVQISKNSTHPKLKKEKFIKQVKRLHKQYKNIKIGRSLVIQLKVTNSKFEKKAEFHEEWISVVYKVIAMIPHNGK